MEQQSQISEWSIRNEIITVLNAAKPVKSFISSPFSNILELDSLQNVYRNILASDNGHITDRILDRLNIKINLSPADGLKNIPANGPLIIAANHPFGGIEGIIMASILRKVRSDFKIMANHFLKIFPDLRDLFIFVDPFDHKKAKKRNISPIKEAIKHVNDGGALVIFPAGAVSHFNWADRIITDPPWQDNIGKLISKLKAPVLPLFFEGANNALFQTFSMVHPFLRTLRLPKEFLNKEGRQFKVHVGSAISKNQLDKFDKPNDLLDYLRRRTYNLSNRDIQPCQKQHPFISKMIQVAAPKPKSEILKDYRSIPSSQFLYEQGDYQVFYTYGYQTPNILHEIGRQREITFRAVNEGTGKEIDLDRFDKTYIHLTAWDKSVNKIIGAYRLGPSDILLNKFGRNGLYTSTLFKINKSFFKEVFPALEMGRSFITKDYQKNFKSLFLLWRGIGEYVFRNPRFRYLFGPVSISVNYTAASQKMIVDYLTDKHHNKHLAKKVRPRNFHKDQLQISKLMNKKIDQFSELDQMISDIETENKGVPILIKQYLKLGAEFIRFNRDEDFNNTLDGLIVVDLCKTPEKELQKYFGKESAASYKTYHEIMNGSSFISTEAN